MPWTRTWHRGRAAAWPAGRTAPRTRAWPCPRASGAGRRSCRPGRAWLTPRVWRRALMWAPHGGHPGWRGRAPAEANPWLRCRHRDQDTAGFPGQHGQAPRHRRRHVGCSGGARVRVVRALPARPAPEHSCEIRPLRTSGHLRVELVGTAATKLGGGPPVGMMAQKVRSLVKTASLHPAGSAHGLRRARLPGARPAAARPGRPCQGSARGCPGSGPRPHPAPPP